MNRLLRIGLLLILIGLLFNTYAQNAKKNKPSSKTGSIHMEKTPCYGKCPVYKITITSDGHATYEGIQNTEKKGFFEKKLSSHEVKALFDKFNQSNFWNFQDEYKARVSDVPTTYLTYSYDDKTKKVTDQWDGPKELKELEKLVEAIADSKGWKEVKQR